MKQIHALIATAICLVGGMAFAADIAWKSDVASGTWSDGSNWEGGVAPGAEDTAIFNSAATVSFSAEASVAKITFNADVEFRATNNQSAWHNIKATTWEGTGTVTLVCVGISNLSGDTTISANIRIPTNKKANGEEQDVWVEPNGGNITIRGNISGDGLLKLSGKTNASIYLSGDNSGFTGTARTENGNYCHVRFASASAGFANGTFYNQQDNIVNTVSGEWTNGGTIKFGSWIDRYTRDTGAYFWRFGATTAYIEIGALNAENDYLGHSIAENKNNNMRVGLRKVGTGTLTIGAALSHGKETFIDNGTLLLNVANALDVSSAITFGEDSEDYPLASYPGGTLKYGTGITTDLGSKIKDSKAPVSIDTNGNSPTYSAFGDNQGGITKKGDGTLTIDVQKDLPLPARIEGGALVLTKCSANLNSGTIYIADGATLQMNPRHTNNTQLQLLADVKVSGAGMLKLDTNSQSSWRIYSDMHGFSGVLEFTGATAPGAANGLFSTAKDIGLANTTLLLSGMPESFVNVWSAEMQSTLTLGAIQVLSPNAGVWNKETANITFGEKAGSESILNGPWNCNSGNTLNLTKDGATPLTLGSGFSIAYGSLTVKNASVLTVNADLTGELPYALTINDNAVMKIAGSGKVTLAQFQKAEGYSVKAVDNAPLTVAGEVNLDNVRLDVDFSGIDQETAYTLLSATSLTGDLVLTDESTRALAALNAGLAGHWKIAKSGNDVVLKYCPPGFIIKIAGVDVDLDGEAGLGAWLESASVTYEPEAVGDLAATNANGISPLAAYLLGYTSYSDKTAAPSIAAPTVEGENFKLNFDLAGQTANKMDACQLQYAVATSNDNLAWSVVEATKSTTPPVTLAFAEAGLYNKLVADIVAK